MDIKKLILDKIKQKGKVTVADINKLVGFSRAYIHRFFKELEQEGKIIKVGKTKGSFYINADKESWQKAKSQILSYKKVFKREGLKEDFVLDQIKSKTGILLGIKDNVRKIFEYAFTEILNNAIDHSESEKVEVRVFHGSHTIDVNIEDFGVGIFKNIKQKKNLETEIDAMRQLIKGKQTTAPEKHSGEGIFFTSKAVNTMNIFSFDKNLFFNNNIDDVFVDFKRNSIQNGTQVVFIIDLQSDFNLEKIFKKYTDADTFEFTKTKVRVDLYKIGTEFISRSEAKRLLIGLDKFEEIMLDFKDVESVGQGFADEIFRVWQNNHPDVVIETENMSENVKFMIDHVKRS